MIAANVCKMNFQVSFLFIIYHLLIYHLPFTIYHFSDYSDYSEFSDYSDSPPLEGRVREGLLRVPHPPQAAESPGASLQPPHPPVPCGWGQD